MTWETPEIEEEVVERSQECRVWNDASCSLGMSWVVKLGLIRGEMSHLGSSKNLRHSAKHQ